jgi:Fic family protein
MQLDYLAIDEQLHHLHATGTSTERVTVEQFSQRFDACWIYHDLSVEGVAFRDDDLQRALAGQQGHTWRESQLLAKVRHMRRALDFVRGAASDHVPFELDFVKGIHRQLQHDTDESAGRYRKDGGASTAYRHDIVPPKSISYRLRRLVSFVQECGPSAFGHPIEMACHIHRELMEIFPFNTDNGIVARLAMNYWILRHGYAPALVTIHERQRYFDSYLLANGEFRRLVVDAIHASGEAWIRGLCNGRAAAA